MTRLMALGSQRTRYIGRWYSNQHNPRDSWDMIVWKSHIFVKILRKSEEMCPTSKSSRRPSDRYQYVATDLWTLLSKWVLN
nr:CNT_HP1_G0015820.mRNA.1.CDS.1 [Saccharomyces cerevisiae]